MRQARTARGDALPLVREIVLLHAGQRAGRSVAGVVKRVGGIDLIGDVLIILRGDHRRFGCGHAASIGHLIGAAEIAAGGGELRIDVVTHIGLNLRKLRGERGIIADHAAVGIRRQLALKCAEIALHIAGLCIGPAAVQERLRISTDLSSIRISLRGITLQGVQRAGFGTRQASIVQTRTELAENALQQRLRRRPWRSLRLLCLCRRRLSAHRLCSLSMMSLVR